MNEEPTDENPKVAAEKAAKKVAVERTIAQLRCSLTGYKASLKFVEDAIGDWHCQDKTGDHGDNGTSSYEHDRLCGRRDTLKILIPKIENLIAKLEENGEVICPDCHKAVDLERVAMGYDNCIDCSSRKAKKR